MKITIIIFWFMNDWGMYGRTYEKIAENLAAIPEIERIICLFPPIKRKSISWPIEPGKIENVNEKITIITIFNGILEYNHWPYGRILNLINRGFVNNYINQIFKKLNLKDKNTILWVFPPHIILKKLISRIPHGLLVTQMIDNNIYNLNFNLEKKKHIENQYRNLAKISDAVITSSKANHDIFSNYNKECGLFENAVDNKFILEPSELPYRMNNCRPSLGYLGFITQRTDLSLLEYVARKRKNYDVIIAGPLGPEQNIDNLKRLPNVTYLGAIPYSDAPRFIQKNDICLIPHIDTPYSRTMSPLKLYQYLGSGRPIVTTNVAGVERFRSIISIAENYDDFIYKIDENLQERNPALKNKRIEIAKQETWEKRSKEIWEYVHRIYSGKMETVNRTRKKGGHS